MECTRFSLAKNDAYWHSWCSVAGSGSSPTAVQNRIYIVAVQKCMCVVTLAFFGFLRSGEVTVPSDSAFDPAAHLTFDDVKVDNITNPTLLKIRLKASKTDPFRNGIDIVVGRTNNKLCPVTAVMAYLAARGNGPGFLVQIPGQKTPHKALFCGGSPPGFGQSWIRPKAYTGHSFRIGAATTANAWGLNDSTIQMLGRWSSSAYLVYVRTPREQLATYSSVLGQDLS